MYPRLQFYLLDIVLAIDVASWQIERSSANVDVLVELGQFPDVSFQMFPFVSIKPDPDLESRRRQTRRTETSLVQAKSSFYLRPSRAVMVVCVVVRAAAYGAKERRIESNNTNNPDIIDNRKWKPMFKVAHCSPATKK